MFWEWEQNSSLEVLQSLPCLLPSFNSKYFPLILWANTHGPFSFLVKCAPLCTGPLHKLPSLPGMLLPPLFIFRYQLKCAFSNLPDWKNPITFSLGNTNLSFLVLTTILHLLDYLVGIGVPQFPQGTVNSECKNRSVLAHHGAQHSF